MKRKPLTHAARLLCALALSLSLAPAAFAADPSEPTQPSPCYQVGMFITRQVRNIRIAISPRLATNTFFIIRIRF